MMSCMIRSQNQRNNIVGNENSLAGNSSIIKLSANASSIVSKRRRMMKEEEPRRHHYEEKQFYHEVKEERYALASLIIQLNEEGIKLFRQSNLLVSRSFECFEQAASNLACLTSSIVAEQEQEQQQQSNKRRRIITSNERPLQFLSQPAAASQQHDYEQAKLISITCTADVSSLVSLEEWVHVVGTIVLHNLGLVALKRASVAALDPSSAKAIERKGIELLKLCLSMTRDFEAPGVSSTIVYQVETSTNYLMGLTFYKQASRQYEEEDSILLLHQSMKYLLDGLDAMNAYQTCLLNHTVHEEDATSLPIGLFYVLGNVLYQLQKPEYAMEAFERCSWFVQSRQQQQSHPFTYIGHSSIMRMGTTVVEHVTTNPIDTTGAPAA